MSNRTVPSFGSILAGNLFNFAVHTAREEQRRLFNHEVERIRLNEEQRHDYAQIEMEDAAENERQVKELEAWLQKESALHGFPEAKKLGNKGGAW